MFIAVCSREIAENLIHHHPHVMISITDPPPFGHGPSGVSFCSDKCRLATLSLSFGDFHEAHFGIKKCGKTLEEYAMKLEHGKMVKDFLDVYKGKITSIIVHCEAGLSRSPSMALAIAEHYAVPRKQIEPVFRNWDVQPLNPHVYKITKLALMGD